MAYNRSRASSAYGLAELYPLATPLIARHRRFLGRQTQPLVSSFLFLFSFQTICRSMPRKNSASPCSR
jgi:hypothetical protein